MPALSSRFSSSRVPTSSNPNSRNPVRRPPVLRKSIFSPRSLEPSSPNRLLSTVSALAERNLEEGIWRLGAREEALEAREKVKFLAAANDALVKQLAQAETRARSGVRIIEKLEAASAEAKLSSTRLSTKQLLGGQVFSWPGIPAPLNDALGFPKTTDDENANNSRSLVSCVSGAATAGNDELIADLREDLNAAHQQLTRQDAEWRLKVEALFKGSNHSEELVRLNNPSWINLELKDEESTTLEKKISSEDEKDALKSFYEKQLSELEARLDEKSAALEDALAREKKRDIESERRIAELVAQRDTLAAKAQSFGNRLAGTIRRNKELFKTCSLMKKKLIEFMEIKTGVEEVRASILNEGLPKEKIGYRPPKVEILALRDGRTQGGEHHLSERQRAIKKRGKQSLDFAGMSREVKDLELPMPKTFLTLLEDVSDEISGEIQNVASKREAVRPKKPKKQTPGELLLEAFTKKGS